MSKQLTKQKLNCQATRNEPIKLSLEDKRMFRKSRWNAQNKKHPLKRDKISILDVMMKYESCIPKCFIQVDMLPDIPKKLHCEIPTPIDNCKSQISDRRDNSRTEVKYFKIDTSESLYKGSNDLSDSNTVNYFSNYLMNFEREKKRLSNFF